MNEFGYSLMYSIKNRKTLLCHEVTADQIPGYSKNGWYLESNLCDLIKDMESEDGKKV